MAPPKEIARRWRAFRREVRRFSSSPVARVIGPLLGEETRRRRWVERLRPEAPAPSPVAVEDVETFPTNYVPSSLVATPRDHDVSDTVQFVPVTSNDPHDLVVAFREALESDKEWLLVVHDTVDEYARRVIAATLLRQSADADVVFGDEVGDVATIPVLKPRDVGPHTLLSYNVVGRPALMRRQAVLRAGGLHDEAGRAAEHDLYLRLAETGATFHHVPQVFVGRTFDERHHDDLGPDTRRVVAEALARRGITARVSSTSRPSVVTWSPLPDSWPSIDVVIPTRDRVDLLRRCIESVESSTYPNVTITILDNDSEEPATVEYLESTTHRVVECPGPFNYAAIINRGVEHCHGDFIVTLNNDTVVRTPDWLEQMVGVASLDDVSVVGVTLVDRHDVHEHDGIVIAPYPQHLRRGINYLVEDDFVLARRDVAAVTGAVQMISRARYLELGGMDEELAVVMNDVDLCLRSQIDGGHVVMVPDVEVSHFAGSSRGRLDPWDDRNHFVRRWDVFGALVDPYFPESLRLLGSTMVYRGAVTE